LHYTHQRYWVDLRIALPRTAGVPRFDRRVDATQIGAVALALIFGRPLRSDEYPSRVPDMVSAARAMSPTGAVRELPAAFRTWLLRALQIDARSSYASALDAGAELDQVLHSRDQAAET